MHVLEGSKLTSRHACSSALTIAMVAIELDITRDLDLATDKYFPKKKPLPNLSFFGVGLKLLHILNS